MSTYDERLVSFERRLRELEREFGELRGSAPTATATVEARPRPARPFPVAPGLEASRAEPSTLGRKTASPSAPPAPVARPAAAAPDVSLPRAPREFPPEREPFDLSRLLGARTLAVTGGVVSLLGIVFFFALAVQRGWIGPVARVSLGAIASALALGAGWWLRRRFGETSAATAAAAVGIAGGFATLLAATAKYDLVAEPLALVLAAGIAAVATAVALAWSDELLAGLGLVGAIVAPLALGLADVFGSEDILVPAEGLPAAAVGFALLMLAAAIAVSLQRGWSALLVAAAACAGLEVALVLADPAGREGAALALAVAFWALVLGTGVFESLRRGRLTHLGGWFVVAGSAFSGYAAAALYDGRALGIALLAAALANGVLAAVVFGSARDLASVLWATALGLAAIGTAQLLSEATLTIAWAAEAAVLAWLAERTSEPRFRLAALSWLALALLHALAVDAPVSLLFERSEHPASAVPSLLALGAAAFLTAWLRAAWHTEAGGGWAAFPVNLMLRYRDETRLALVAASGVLALEAASLAVLELVPSWDWGHMAMTGLWGATAIGLMLARQRLAGVIWAGATVALALGYDLLWLSGSAPWCSLGVAAATALAAALLFEDELGPVSVAGAGGGACLAVAAALGIAGGDLQWLLVLAVGAGYVALGAAFLGPRRDQSTLLWSLGLTIGTGAAFGLLDGIWLVLALATAAGAAAVLARFEERLDFAALTLLGLGLAVTLATEAVPADLFSAQRHPGSGVPAALAVIAAAAVHARLRSRERTVVIWCAAVVTVLSVSLAILELFESLGGPIETSFQRGHTAVSALWGLLGLALLYAGLVRRSTALQLAGFGLFGISLAKLFVYDLAFLSSITRALSFLAVGAVLIAGGFFYQRLAAVPDRRRPIEG
jgi:uncharacterized membrane protein